MSSIFAQHAQKSITNMLLVLQFPIYANSWLIFNIETRIRFFMTWKLILVYDIYM